MCLGGTPLSDTYLNEQASQGAILEVKLRERRYNQFGSPSFDSSLPPYTACFAPPAAGRFHPHLTEELHHKGHFRRDAFPSQPHNGRNPLLRRVSG
jgi:hypothetical protein